MEKSIAQHSEPKVGDIPKGFVLPAGTDGSFEPRPSHIYLVERNQFSGAADEDPAKHMETFIDYVCSIPLPAGVTQDQAKEVMFTFSLKDAAKEWFRDLDKTAMGIKDWNSLALAFYKKYFSPTKTNAIRSQIMNFKQWPDEEFHESWNRFKKLVRSIPHHGFQQWYLCNQFYIGLYDDHRNILDVAANGRFQNNIGESKGWKIIEDMAAHKAEFGNPRMSSNDNSFILAQLEAMSARFDELEKKQERPPPTPPPQQLPNDEIAELKNMIQLIMVEMQKSNAAYEASILEMKSQLTQLDKNAAEVPGQLFSLNQRIETVHAITLRSGVTLNGPADKEELIEKEADNSSREVSGTSGRSTPSTPPRGRSTPLTSNVNSFDGVSGEARRSTPPSGRSTPVPSSVIAEDGSNFSNEADVWVDDPSKLPECPEGVRDFLYGGKTTPKKVDGSTSTSRLDPSTVNGSYVTRPGAATSYNKDKVLEVKTGSKDAGMRDVEERAKLLLTAPYPERLIPTRNEVAFEKFKTIIKSLNVQVPFLELVNQVPAYTNFMKQLLNKKRSLARVESVAFTEGCSSYLTHATPPKLSDPGSFSVPCKIGTFDIEKALCDLGASISVMPLSLARKLGLKKLACTSITVQMADRSMSRPVGVLEDIPVQIGEFFFPVDFVVLDIPEDVHIPIILGRPFLHTAGAVIDVGLRTLTFKVGKRSINFSQSPVEKGAMSVTTCNAVLTKPKTTYVYINDDSPLVPASIPALTPPPQIGSKLEETSTVLSVAGTGLGKEEPPIVPAVKEPIIQRGGLGCLSYSTDEEPDECPKTEPVKVSKYDLEFDEPVDVKARVVSRVDEDPACVDNGVKWSPTAEISVAEGTFYSQKPWSEIFRIFGG